MKIIGPFEAKTHLGELLDRVERCESITITRYGKPAAQLIPVADSAKRDRADVISEMLNFDAGRKLKGASIREMIGEGRRF